MKSYLPQRENVLIPDDFYWLSHASLLYDWEIYFPAIGWEQANFSLFEVFLEI